MREGTNLRIILTAVLVGTLGASLLYLSGRPTLWKDRVAGQAFVAQLGGLLLAAVTLSILWEFAGKRSFAAEILAKVGLGADIERAGIVRVTDQYLKEVEWDSYFEGVHRLDIVVAYGRTWRRAHWEQLTAISRKGDARIQVILPDPLDAQSLAVLADRFSRTPAKLHDDIVEAAQEFMQFRDAAADVHI